MRGGLFGDALASVDAPTGAATLRRSFDLQPSADGLDDAGEFAVFTKDADRGTAGVLHYNHVVPDANTPRAGRSPMKEAYKRTSMLAESRGHEADSGGLSVAFPVCRPRGAGVQRGGRASFTAGTNAVPAGACESPHGQSLQAAQLRAMHTPNLSDSAAGLLSNRTRHRATAIPLT